MIKDQIKRILGKFGYKLTKSKKASLLMKPDAFLYQGGFFKTQDHLVIFDVGAHIGQTCNKYRKLFPDAKIYAFEPFIDSFKILYDAVSGDEKIAAYNLALGNQIGKVTFYINKFSATNSLLSTHVDSEKIWGDNLLTPIDSKIVNITTIDEFLKNNMIERINILKLDTQGTEFQIIEGADKALKEGRIDLIYLEIITLPTYEDQKYLDEILFLMRNKGFKLINFYNLSLTTSEQLRQLDAIFLRNDIVPESDKLRKSS